MKFGTKAIHAGLSHDPSTGAVMTPIFQTSTYAQASPGVHKGFEYSRTSNPTRAALESNLAALENGRYGLAFASGLAAIDAVLKLLQAGDEVIATSDLYGGSYRIFTKIFEPLGIRFKFVDMTDIEKIRSEITDKTKLVWTETPTNPTLKIIDILGIADILRETDVLFGVDNTFATPYLQNPLDMGADIVMHSATKYLGGHSDVIMGALVVKDETLAERLYFIQNSCGAICGPMDSFLVLRGIKTLHLRMQAHCANAAQIALFLKDHPAVDQVYWPGFEDHANHEVAIAQMRDFGGMVSFSLAGNRMEDAVQVCSNTQIFTLAESLGGVESLIGHPASMTHAAIPEKERVKTGVVNSLLRLSVGIEDIEDLLDDLEQALNRVLK